MERKSLEEYAAQYQAEEMEPVQDLRVMAEISKSYEERKHEADEAQRLKESISAQLEQGLPPQNILYTAITTIGLLTHDEEWAEAGHGILEGIYSDIAQQSFLTDTAAIAEKRLNDMQAAYLDKVRRQLQRDLVSISRIGKSIRETLQVIEETVTS